MSDLKERIEKAFDAHSMWYSGAMRMMKEKESFTALVESLLESETEQLRSELEEAKIELNQYRNGNWTCSMCSARTEGHYVGSKQPAPAVSEPTQEGREVCDTFTPEELLVREAICGTGDCENDPLCPEWYEDGCIAADICKHLKITLPKEVPVEAPKIKSYCQCGTNPYPPDNHCVLWHSITHEAICMKCGRIIEDRTKKGGAQ